MGAVVGAVVGVAVLGLVFVVVAFRASKKRKNRENEGPTESDVERMFVKKMERQLQSDEENSMASIKQGKLIV